MKSELFAEAQNQGSKTAAVHMSIFALSDCGPVPGERIMKTSICLAYSDGN